MHWHDGVWAEDELNLRFDLALRLTREAATWPEALALSPGGRRSLNSRTQAANVIGVLRAKPEITVRFDHFDADPLALATPDGTVNLADGTMHANAREQYCSRRTLIPPEDGVPELWVRCMEEWFSGDAELIQYMHCLCGYWLTGGTREKQFTFLFGRGDTGKSVFVNTIMHIMGTYAQGASMDTFTETIHEAHPEEKAVMQGARLVTAPETEQARKFKVSLIKQMTGDDVIRARFMYGKSFEFRGTAKICIFGNHQPHVRSIDDAFKRRLHMVPMRNHVPEERQDKKLEEKLQAEAGRILRWMIDGHLELQRLGGLPIPRAVRSLVDEYTLAQDSFGQFLEECIDSGSGFVTNKDLWRIYSKYAEDQGIEKGNTKLLYEAMRAKGFESGKSNGQRGFKGAKLRVQAYQAEREPGSDDEDIDL